MAGKMWIGLKGREQWLKAPAIGPDFSSVGHFERAEYLGGGVGIEQSASTHKEYVLSWNAMSTDDLNALLLLHKRTRGGKHPVYFVDPSIATSNLLPEDWAEPALACYDAVPLTGDVRPDLVDAPDTPRDYPTEHAQYPLAAGMTSRRVYIPVPPGATAWVGFHGGVTGTGGFRVTPFKGLAAQAPVYPIMMSASAFPRVNTSFSSADGITGIEIDLATVDATSLLTIGNVVQIHPNGVLPPLGGFLPGRGNAGCTFEGAPQESPNYLHRGGSTAVSAKLIETGGHL